MTKIIAIIIAAFTFLLPLKAIAQDTTNLHTYLNEKGVIFYKDYTATLSNTMWQLLLQKKATGHALSIFDKASKKQLYIFENDSPLETFVSIDFMEWPALDTPLFITTWSHGAHGEYVAILDPTLQKIAFEAYGSWPIAYEVCDSSVVMTIPGDMQENGTPEMETVQWFNTKFLKRFSGTKTCSDLLK